MGKGSSKIETNEKKGKRLFRATEEGVVQRGALRGHEDSNGAR